MLRCYSITSIVLASVTSISSYAFAYCYSLKSIVLPKVRSVSNYGFLSCLAIKRVALQDATLYAYSFSNCQTIMIYDFSACTRVPSLYNKNAFNNINSICKMLIPSALYDVWKTATNWSNYIDYMVPV